MSFSSSSWPELSGPELIPASPTHLLFCLHGFGADGNDLMGLASPLQGALDPHGITLGVLCPNGPSPTPAGFGRQWFSDKSWTFRDKEGIAIAKDLLWDYITAVAKAHTIPLQNVAVLGFSQGAMTALYAAPRWPEAIGALISCAGVAMWQEEMNATTCQKPPVLLLHGTEDDVVPADASVAAHAGLVGLGFNARLELLDDLGHGIDGRVLAHTVAFLSEIWSA